MKRFRIMYNIGRCKYVVYYHNGEKKHKDGSDFFDLEIFSNKKKLNEFTKQLTKEGYFHQ